MTSLSNLKALSAAVTFFVCLYFGLTLSSNYLANNSSNFPALLPWLNFSAYLLYLVSGLVAGIMSKQNIIFIGSMAGLVAVILAVLLFGVGAGIFDVAVTLAWGLFLGSIGGGIAFSIKRKTTNARQKKACSRTRQSRTADASVRVQS